MSKSMDVRTLAVKIIKETCYNKGYINKQLQEVRFLSSEDMGLLTNIVYGVVKNHLLLEKLLNEYVVMKKNKVVVRVILEVALYQKLFLSKVPDYAIIDAAVRQARQFTNAYAASFVNGALRKLFEQELIVPDFLASLAMADRLVYQYSCPKWIVSLLQAQYGEDRTTTFLKSANEPNRQFARVNVLKAKRADIVQDSAFIPAAGDVAVEYLEGNIAATKAYQEGLVSIQNISSQQVAIRVAPQPKERILDMCAAPGGKTMHLAEYAADKAKITALDIYQSRVDQITEQAKRLGVTCVQAVCADALKFDKIAYFDKILLDAPCSGLGVLRQKPEIRYHIKPEELDALIVLQRQLLSVAWRSLRKGGVLTYSTCTVNKNENERQVQFFVQQHDDAELIYEELIFDQAQEGYSGFYIAQIKKGSVK